MSATSNSISRGRKGRRLTERERRFIGIFLSSQVIRAQAGLDAVSHIPVNNLTRQYVKGQSDFWKSQIGTLNLMVHRLSERQEWLPAGTPEFEVPE